MISINDLQKLLGKKSKEQASGAISKLSADEWNTLVQGVIQHYGLLVLNADTNTVTIRDSSGNAHTYELTPYIPKTITKIEFKDGDITVPKVEASQETATITIIKPTSFKITYSDNSSSEVSISEIGDITKVTYTTNFINATGFNIQISDNNISNIPTNASTDLERTLGTVTCEFSYDGNVLDTPISTLTKQADLKQQGVPIPNTLLYTEKSLSTTVGKNIKNGEDTIANNIDLSNVTFEEFNYILDDGDSTKHSDEIVPNTQTSGYFIQILLIRNPQHKIYYFDSSGLSTEPKIPIENTRVLNQSNNTIYSINNYTYTKDGVSNTYKALFILKQTNGPEELCLLIDNK